ncbi:MAG: hypothetical protein FWD92_03985 [Methanomassiliicoccaceae archaeon]|nr:hypothetical protein [Methanomassiliicoccaceae archaeon]
MNDDMMIMPTGEIKALMEALLAGDRIQEPLEVIISDDAENFIRIDNFLGLLGLSTGSAIRKTVLSTARAGAIQRSIEKEDLYLRLRMVAHEEKLSEHFEISADPDIRRPPDTQESEDPGGDVALEQGTGGDTADAHHAMHDENETRREKCLGERNGG